MRTSVFVKVFTFLFSISFIFLSCKKEKVTTENSSSIKAGWINTLGLNHGLFREPANPGKYYGFKI